MTVDDLTLDELLKSIENKTGPYSMDHLKHAENVINQSSKYAKEIRKRLLHGETLK